MLKLSKQLAQIIAPPRCLGCLRENVWLCELCRENAPRQELTCVGCGKTTRAYLRSAGRTCVKCREKISLTGVVSAGPYGSPLFKRGVKWLKFKGVRGLAPVLAGLIADRLLVIAPLSELRAQAVLLPIPLHKRRQRERGFNQSEDIALAVSAATGIAMANILERSRATWTQTKLPLNMRQENLAGAFALRQDLPQKKYFLLVDDVTTTGSTLSAAARVLQVDGAKQIWGVTAARG